MFRVARMILTATALMAVSSPALARIAEAGRLLIPG